MAPGWTFSVVWVDRNGNEDVRDASDVVGAMNEAANVCNVYGALSFAILELRDSTTYCVLRATKRLDGSWSVLPNNEWLEGT